MAHILKNYELEEVSDDVANDEADYELMDAGQQVSSHINMIPLQSAVQTPRLFYGSRFFSQAHALEEGEAPLVQNLNKRSLEGHSYDRTFGESAMARIAKNPGVVVDVNDSEIKVKYEDGTDGSFELYKGFEFNQKGGVSNQALVKPGDKFSKGSVLAKSDFTDANGTINMGRNLRVAMVPYRGHTMDDAIVISESAAKKLKSIHYKVLRQADDDENTIYDKKNFISLFPKKFKTEDLEHIDDNGIAKTGSILQPGQPIMLATTPRVVNSDSINAGNLSRTLAATRRDATNVWEGKYPAEVIDARKTKKGWKVSLRYLKTAEAADKVAFRHGGKGVISKVIPDDRMPRNDAGEPMEVLLNHLSVFSRTNSATPYELMLGKIAHKNGKPLIIDSFTQKGEAWYDKVQKMLDENGVQAQERLYDPVSGRYLVNPVTVGYGFVQKLQHVGSDKLTDRSTGAYSSDDQPLKGGTDAAQAKRLSGLEVNALRSAGAYDFLKEGITLRGQRNDAFWRDYRSGKTTKDPGRPFVWDKFEALLAGSGIQARKMGKGVLRLAPFTDKDLDADAIEVKNGEMVKLDTLDPIEGGLFDKRLVSTNKWGYVKLPRPIINPAYEEAVRQILGVTNKDFRAILAGKKDLA